MSRCVLLLNRASGGNQRGLDAVDVCRRVEEAFRLAGHEVTSVCVEPTAFEGKLGEIIADSPDVILIGGGDGSVSAAARRIGGTDITLGVLPMGTFNLAARDLGVPLDIEAAATFLATAEECPIDVLDVSGHACLCTTILGFYPDFANFFERRDHGGRWWRKALKLMMRLRSSFIQSRPLHLSWTADGGNGQARTKFSAFVPGRYKNTAGLIPERTDFRAGILTAYIGTQAKPSSLVRALIDYAIGHQERIPDLKVIATSKLTLHAARRSGCRAMLDGEMIRLSFPIVFSILPKHLKVLSFPDIIAPITPAP